MWKQFDKQKCMEMPKIIQQFEYLWYNWTKIKTKANPTPFKAGVFPTFSIFLERNEHNRRRNEHNRRRNVAIFGKTLPPYTLHMNTFRRALFGQFLNSCEGVNTQIERLLSGIYQWILMLHTEKSLRNFINSTRNYIVFTIVRLISGWFNKISKGFLCV